ncbi:hypothetical protein Tco_1411174 [Tanacetum coccineum]
MGDPCESFNELMDTPLDFLAFVMNQLKVDTLTLELLAGLTSELMKGTCKSLVELEYLFEEIYKSTIEKLDWNNPEGQQYPHDLRKPLPLIPNSRGRQVIPFDHFINNDLAYLCGGVSSRTYATSVMKTKAADYGHIKWIEELAPNTMESARDITIHREDDKLYTFKEGDFKRLRLQDIEDMFILLVQGKLTNLNVEERLAFSVSLRMFTRSIVIQRRVEDLQLGVESYQKKLNITKPDMYRFDLKRRDAYTAYSNPIGFIYQKKDKKNKLMRIDELHKFSDGTLDDVQTALNDCLKGIRMENLPQTIWRQSDRERAATMIQAIDKQLKSRRIMRILERFVGGRPYEEHPSDIIHNENVNCLKPELTLEQTQQGVSYEVSVLENQVLSASLLICLGKRDCVERIPSGNSLHTTLPPNEWISPTTTAHQSRNLGNDNKTSELGDDGEIEKEGEWTDDEQPLDLVDVRKDLVYETLIEKMLSCSLNFNFRIKKGDPSNLKIPCMIGQKFIANAYIDLDLPMNVMSLAYYNAIRNQGYEYRGLNFVGIGKDMHVFVGNMSHVMDFTILENVEANIDPSLS